MFFTLTPAMIKAESKKKKGTETMGSTVPYSKYAAAMATIEALKAELARQNHYGLIVFMVFAFAVVGLICYTSIKKKQIKYFGSSQEYETFIAWKKKQSEKKNEPKKTNN